MSTQLGNYPFLAKVKWCEIIEDNMCKESVDRVVLYADSFKDAMEIIESYYRNDLISAEIQAFEDGLILLSEETFNAVKTDIEQGV